jgi:S1-C subfamily serine protease
MKKIFYHLLTYIIIFNSAIIHAQDIREAIVKIYTVENAPSFINPWNMENINSFSGSGAIIANNYILTNAHVVSDQTFIQVRRYGDAKKYQAQVDFVSHDADLALLKVANKEFFKDITPLEFGTLPFNQEEVLVYGFPSGGDRLSNTKGILSRIEHRTYAHSSRKLLAGQIDAALNSGNSGGPVIVNDKIVGVAMQTLRSADNIGYMIPIPIIEHFLTDIADGKYDGFPNLGIGVQAIENKDFKRSLGLNKEQTGIFITNVLPSSPADGNIQVGDVLMKIDGYVIAGDGTIEFRKKERTYLGYIIQKYQINETVEIELLRNKKIHKAKIKLFDSFKEHELVAKESYDQQPSYFIYGGIVFSPLTKRYLSVIEDNQRAFELVTHLVNNSPKVRGEEIVIIINVLAADVNEGYHNTSNWIVNSVNGHKINNLKELVTEVEKSTGTFITFTGRHGQKIVLDRDKVKQQQSLILQQYRVDKDRSLDL